jgi:hypothetical protein
MKTTKIKKTILHPFILLILVNFILFYTQPSISPLVTFITALFCVIAVVSQSKNISNPKSQINITFAFTALITTSLISGELNNQNIFTLINGSPARHAGISYLFISYCCFILGMRRIDLKRDQKYQAVLLIFLEINIATSIFQALKVIPNCIDINRGSCGITSNSNFASGLASVYLIIIYWKFTQNKLNILSFTPRFFFANICLLTTKSSQGFILALIGVFLIAFSMRKFKHLFIIIPILLTIAFSLGDPSNLKSNLITGRKRLIASRVGLEIGLDNLFFGVGIDNLSSEFAKYIKPSDLLYFSYNDSYTHTHNIFTQYFATLGIFGLVILVYIIFIGFRGVNYISLTQKTSQNLMIFLIISIWYLCLVQISIPDLYIQMLGFFSLGRLSQLYTSQNDKYKALKIQRLLHIHSIVVVFIIFVISFSFYGRSYFLLKGNELSLIKPHFYSCSEKVQILTNLRNYDTIKVNAVSLSNFSVNCSAAQLLAAEKLLAENKEIDAKKIVNLALDSNPNNPKILIYSISNFKHSDDENFMLCNKIWQLDKLIPKSIILKFPDSCV